MIPILKSFGTISSILFIWKWMKYITWLARPPLFIISSIPLKQIKQMSWGSSTYWVLPKERKQKFCKHPRLKFTAIPRFIRKQKNTGGALILWAFAVAMTKVKEPRNV